MSADDFMEATLDVWKISPESENAECSILHRSPSSSRGA